MRIHSRLIEQLKSKAGKKILVLDELNLFSETVLMLFITIL